MCAEEKEFGFSEEFPRKLSICLGMGRKKGTEWAHVTCLGNTIVQCNYCGFTFSAPGSTRIRNHFLGTAITVCPKLPTELREKFRAIQEASTTKKLKTDMALTDQGPSGPGKRTAAADADDDGDYDDEEDQTPAAASKRKKLSKSPKAVSLDHAQRCLARFLYAEGIAPTAASSPYLKDALQAYMNAGNGRGSMEALSVCPTRAACSGVLLQEEVAAVEKVRLKTHGEAVDKHGYTLSANTFTDTNGREVTNVFMTTTAGHSFVQTIDASGKPNAAEHIASVLKTQMKGKANAKHNADSDAVGVKGLPGGARTCCVIVTDSATCKAAGALIEGAHPWISVIPCTVSECDSFLKAVGKITVFADLISLACRLIAFINDHAESLSLYRAHSHVELVAPTAMRFATSFIACQRVFEAQQSLTQMLADPQWSTWIDSPAVLPFKSEADVIVEAINSKTFWSFLGILRDISTPVIALMRAVDEAAAGSICKVFKLASNVHETISALPTISEGVAVVPEGPTALPLETKRRVEQLWQMHSALLLSPVHAAAHSLDPSVLSNADVNTDPALNTALMEGLLYWLRKVYYRPQDESLRATALVEYASFTNKRGLFGSPELIADVLRLTPYEFWELHGDAVPRLRFAAMKLCAQISTSSIGPRTWLYDGHTHPHFEPGTVYRRMMLFGHYRLEQSLKRKKVGNDIIPWRWRSSVDDADEVQDLAQSGEEEHPQGPPEAKRAEEE
jgi:hypothetical protein